MAIEVGQEAPDFEIKNQFGELVKLSDLRGKKNVVLVFYPFAFTPTCTAELCTIRDEKVSFENDDVQVLRHLDRPGALAEGVRRAGEDRVPAALGLLPARCGRRRPTASSSRRRASRRARTFVIDKEGVVRWSVVNTPADARNTDEYRAALAAL